MSTVMTELTTSGIESVQIITSLLFEEKGLLWDGRNRTNWSD